MGIRGIEEMADNGDPRRLPRGTKVHVTENNHDWVSLVTGIPFSDVGKAYAKSVATGYVCVVEARG